MNKFYHLVDIRQDFKPKRNWAVFLDRDGVINEERHLVHKIEDFKIYNFVYQAIKLLNDHQIPVVVHHNASVVARGLCGADSVVKLNEYMKSKLAEKNAFVDMVLFCPHHPAAFNKKMAFDCPWRKPKTGMLEFVAENYHINLDQSYVVGDAARDLIMAEKAKATGILVKTGHGGEDKVYQYTPQVVKKDVLEAVKFIVNQRKL